MEGTVFCYFIAISFGIAIPIIIVKISQLKEEDKVIELEQKLQRLENKYKAEQELKLATLEKKTCYGKNTLRANNAFPEFH